MQSLRVVIVAILVGVLGSQAAAAQQAKMRQLRIRTVHIRGNTVLRPTEIQQVVKAVNASPSTRDDKLREISEQLVRKYQDSGYYKVRLSDPVVKVVTTTSQYEVVDVAIRVEQGRMYRLSDVAIRGGKAFSSSAYAGFLTLNPGDVFNRSAVGASLERMRKAYGKAGYLNFTPVPDVTFDEEKGTIALTIGIDEGKQFRWGALTVDGENSVPDAKQRLMDMWKRHEGTPCDWELTLQSFLREIGGRPGIKPEQVFKVSFDQSAGVANVEITLADPPTF